MKEEEERIRIMNNNTKNKSRGSVGSAEDEDHVNNVAPPPAGLRSRRESGPSKKRNRSGSVTELDGRQELVIWRRPIQTGYYFFREIPCAVGDAWNRLVEIIYDTLVL